MSKKERKPPEVGLTHFFLNTSIEAANHHLPSPPHHHQFRLHWYHYHLFSYRTCCRGGGGGVVGSEAVTFPSRQADTCLRVLEPLVQFLVLSPPTFGCVHCNRGWCLDRRFSKCQNALLFFLVSQRAEQF